MRIGIFRLTAAAIGLVAVILLFAFVFWTFHALFASFQDPIGTLFPTPSPAASPVSLSLTQSDAGRRISVPAGSTLHLALQDQFPFPGSSLVWSANSSDPNVLALTSESMPSPAPGAGDLPYVATFQARSPGTAILKAHGATTCEAMPKPACPDQGFSITITVLKA